MWHLTKKEKLSKGVFLIVAPNEERKSSFSILLLKGA
nr:MAG TPA: hypothetical protein [Bacteriophage sp.]